MQAIAGLLSRSPVVAHVEMLASLPSDPFAEFAVDASAARDAYGLRDAPHERAYDDIALLASMLCATPAAAVVLLDGNKPWFKTQIGLDRHPTLLTCDALGALVLEQPQQLVEVGDIAFDPRFAGCRIRIGRSVPRFHAAMPVVSPDGSVLGAVCVFDVAPRQLSAQQRVGLKVLARQTQHMLELRRYDLEQQRLLSEREALTQHLQQSRADLQERHELLKEVANHDELTGLLNRAALAQLRADPGAMAKLAQGPYSLLLLDVDHFKQVNDRHGHLLGDRALRVVADAVTASIREGDVAVRFGGEEFLVVLPGTGLAIAYEVAHRIRQRVASSPLPFALTVSAGIAAGDPQRDNPEQVFERADQALYQAKANGRDRVVADDTPR